MSKRTTLPSADELFRKTTTAPEDSPASRPTNLQVAKGTSGQKGPRHEEKVTFYCTPDELTRLERARLGLRADLKISADRGRIVRAALAEILDDFENRGANSSLVRKLQMD